VALLCAKRDEIYRLNGDGHLPDEVARKLVRDVTCSPRHGLNVGRTTSLPLRAF